MADLNRIGGLHYEMMKRCYDQKSVIWGTYGAKGITVCEEWSGEDGFFYFYKWAMENGYSKNLSIDRIDGDKNYSPDNCRWVGNKEQIFNRNVSKIFKYNGSDMLLSDIAKMNGVKYGLLYSRVIQKGMTVEDALYDIMNK